jgi:hypothetical protein
MDEVGYGVEKIYHGPATVEAADELRLGLVRRGNYGLGVAVKAFRGGLSCAGCEEGGPACRCPVSCTIYEMADARAYRAARAELEDQLKRERNGERAAAAAGSGGAGQAVRRGGSSQQPADVGHARVAGPGPGRQAGDRVPGVEVCEWEADRRAAGNGGSAAPGGTRLGGLEAGRPGERDDRAAARETQRADTLGPPLTDAQLKALHAGFYHLGYTRRSDRDARLAEAAEALGQEQPLASFNDLTGGEAGLLIRWLDERRATGEDPVRGSSPVAAPRPQAARPGEWSRDSAEIAAAIGAVIAVLLSLVYLALQQVWRHLEPLTRRGATSTS